MNKTQKIAGNILKDVTALTPMQEGMLFHYLKSPGSNYYFEQLCLNLSGNIDYKIIETAWTDVIKNNEMLRTVFRWDKLKEPVQVILKDHRVDLRYYDLSTLETHEREKSLEEIKIKDRGEGFDLRARPPFRVTICKTGETGCRMMISNHHILYDGWSNGIVLKEFFHAYNDRLHNKLPAGRTKTGFKQFVKWSQSRDTEKQERFWTHYLSGFADPEELPVKEKNQPVKAAIGTGRWTQGFSRQVSRQANHFAQNHKITLASLLYTAWGILLQKYTNSEDVILGAVVSGRTAPVPGIEEMVGLFINTLPLRVQSASHQPVWELAIRIDNALKQLEEHTGTAPVKIKEYCQAGQQTELFDSIVSIENYPIDNNLMLEDAPLSIDSYSMFEMTHYDLTLSVLLLDKIDISFIYRKERFREAVIKQLANHFSRIIKSLLENCQHTISEIDILSGEEKHRILVEFNTTEVPYPQNTSIQRLFADQVEQGPDHTALVGKNPEHLEGARGLVPLYTWHITYRELNNKSDQLAGLLIEKGVKPDTIVGIMVERSIRMIIGILGILKAGGAYLPIDPAYPQERIDYMLNDANVNVLIKKSNVFSETRSPQDLCVLDFEHLNFEFVSNFGFPASNLKSSNLAYVIYTSGSTGKPRGVMVQQASLLNVLWALQNEYPLGETDTYLLKTSYIFDVSVTELFGWFLGGGRLAVLEKGGEKDPQKIIDAVEVYRVSHINFVPSMFRVFLEVLTPGNIHRLSGLKYIFLAGEELLPGIVHRFKDLDSRIMLENIYGPTEGTVYSSNYSLSAWDGCGRIPIGKPMQNMKLYIFDRSDGLQPVGVPGELVIAGQGVARGYLNNPQLTAEKFIEPPLAKGVYSPGGHLLLRAKSQELRAKLYKTGDLARWLGDGNIQFLGRLDRQVKIRGYRIELGEIENQLLGHEQVKEAVVTAAGSGLCAYIVMHPLPAVPAEELRAYLSQHLPAYMIPVHFVYMGSLPVTASGKIDRKALPPAGITPRQQYTAPRNEIEETLVGIWSDLLKLPKEFIGIDDHFFRLGGHSLRAVRLSTRIHKTFDMEVPLWELLETGTIRRQALYIGKTKTGSAQIIPIPSAEEKEYYILSPMQERFFIFQETVKDNPAYNMSEVLLVEGEPDRRRFEESFEKILQRHESLRTSFHLIKGRSIQRVHAVVDFRIGYYENPAARGADMLRKFVWVDHHWSPGEGASVMMNYHENHGKTGIEDILDAFNQSFDLARAPLFRAALVKAGKEKYFLVVVMHHIISDGTSTGILIKDFLSFYKGEELPPLRIQYKDFAQWQQAQRKGQGAGTVDLDRTGETGEKEILNLPTDYPPPAEPDYKGHILGFNLGPGKTTALKELALKQDLTLFVLLLSIFNVFLTRLCRQETIVVGCPFAGRNHPDLEDIIGLFIDTPALKNYPSMEKRFKGFLKEVKTNVLEVYNQQQRKFSRVPEASLFDVMLVLQNMEMPEIEIPGLKITRNIWDPRSAKFDITLYCEEVGESLNFKLEYATALFKEETARGFTGYIKKIISEVLESPNKKIGEIEILSDEEKHRLLVDFNDTAVEYPLEKTVYQVFEEQAQRMPDHIAVISLLSITYRQFYEKANQLARLLRGKGIGTGDIVAVKLERSTEMVIGILGILEAGGAYLPIDPAYPGKRIQYMLTDSSTKFLVTTPGLFKEDRELVNWEGETIFLQDLSVFSVSSVAKKNSCRYTPGSCLAYIIYTSGSTGKPKGVMVHQASLLNVLCALQNEYPLGETDTYLLKTSYIFDVSVIELFGWFLGGGRLVVLEKGGEKDPQKIIDAVERYGVSHINFVPSMFRVFLEVLTPGNIHRLSGLKYIFLAGEELLPEIVHRFKDLGSGIMLENIYGPTEGTVYSSNYSLSAWDGCGRIPIGKPMQNMKLYIFDRSDGLQPVGVPGELVIAGQGVARGYLNNPQLTAEKFIDPPLAKGVYSPGGHLLLRAKLYKTGDLARWLGDGNIQFLGRMDRQVKIRGFRIELGEIENQLLGHEQVKEAVVIAAGSGLCAYIVMHPVPAVPAEEFRAYLSQNLPAYMMPVHFVYMDRLPVTASGKIDRKALPEPEVTGARDFAPPAGEIENKLAEIWSEVLGIAKDCIGVHDNFSRLGGHSLSAARMVSRIYKAFDREISIAEIFNRPTIRRMRDYISTVGSKLTGYAALEIVEEREYYPLSSSQKRLYFLYQVNPRSTAYNIPLVLDLEGKFTAEECNGVFSKLIRRHESLRTSFHVIDSEPVQRIKKEKYKLQFKSHESLVGNKLASSYNVETFIKDFIRPFDLSHAPLIRAGLLQTSEQTYILILDMHHIISDGLSAVIIKKEFSALLRGRELPGLALRYRDYSEWQNNCFDSGAMKERESYWLERFSGEISRSDLPPDYMRPAEREFQGCTLRFHLEANRVEPLKTIAGRGGTGLFMVLLSIYNILLSKLTRQEEVIVGVPAAGRPAPELEGIVGMFVSTLALRNYPTGEKSFKWFLKELRNNTLKDLENQDYPFEELVNHLGIKREAGRNPLFEVMFSFQDRDTAETGFENEAIPGGLTLKLRDYAPPTAQFDMILEAADRGNKLEFAFQYSSELFKEETIRRFIEYYKTILSQVIEYPGIKLFEVEIISGQEKNFLLYELNDTDTDYPKNKTTHELFEEQVERTPDHIALSGHSARRKAQSIERNRESHAPCTMRCAISYRELNKKSGQLAHLLQSRGVTPENIVGIMVERSPEMIIGILGILKAGGAYMPIDPDYPGERIRYMLTDSSTKTLVTTELFKEDRKIGRWEVRKNIEMVFLSSSYLPPFPSSSLPRFPASHSSNLAYVLYTSGTTGKPKSVMVEHRNVVAYLQAFYCEFEITSTDTVIQLTSYSFDVFIEEVFPVLLRGGKIIIPGAFMIMDLDLISRLILRHRVSIIDCTPLLLNEFNKLYTPAALSAGSPLEQAYVHTFISGGDVLKREYIENLLNIGKVYNTYGPTETTVCATYYRCLKDMNSNIPLGKPIANVRCYILCKYGNVLPPGVPGELLVSGAGVARGYLNNPGLTAEKFCLRRPGGALFEKTAPPGPPRKNFSLKVPGKGNYMSYRSNTSYIFYHTGDLARWLPDGNIEFLGRLDHQVKIRGFRIELGEIENQLLGHEQVKEAVVTVGEAKNGDRCLGAYFVPANQRVSDKSSALHLPQELKTYLSHSLPGYMIPSCFIRIEKLPMTSNGKIDRKALPEPDIMRAGEGSGYAAPRNRREEKLAETWSAVLGIEKDAIGIDDDFFELGGHSLKTITLVSRLHKEFNVKLPLAAAFKTSTIRALSQYIKESKEDQYICIEPTEEKEYYLLSSAQRRFYILQQIDMDSKAYNMPMIIKLEGQLVKERFEEAFSKLINRHESLRTSFELLKGEPVQKIHENVNFLVNYYESSDWEPEKIVANFIKPFDLEKLPLLRLGFIKIAEKEHVLMFDIHHIIMDGISTEILINNLLAFYTGKELPPLNLQYKDFSQWQHSLLTSGKLKKQQEYWLYHLSGKLPVIKTPYDYPRPAIQSFDGDSISFHFEKELSRKLNRLIRECGITLYMMLLALYNILLSKFSKQKDIIIGTPISGRNHTDLENIIGLLLETIVIRNYPGDDKTFEEFLDEVKKNTLNAYENQLYPFNEIIKQLGAGNDRSRNPLFDVMLVVQNLNPPLENMKLGDLRITPYQGASRKVSKVDMTLEAEEKDGEIFFNLEYCTKLFKRETMERLIIFFKKVASVVVENKKIKLNDIVISHDLIMVSSDVFAGAESEFEF